MKLNKETKVGLMITVSFSIFITLVALLAKINVSSSGYHLGVYFGFLNNLEIGAPVNIAGGIKIGHVEEIKQSGEKTEVIVWIDKKFKLIRSTKFAIFTQGMIGGKYINVFVPPSANVEDFLQDGEKVYGIDPASIDQMMLTFQSFLQDENGGELLAKIFLNSKKFVKNLNDIAENNKYDIRKSVLAARGMIIMLNQQSKTLMVQLNKFVKNAALLSEKNKEEISVAIRNLSEISKNLNTIIFRLEKGRGTLGKLLVEEDIYNNLKDASIAAKDLFRKLQRDPSKLFFKKQE